MARRSRKQLEKAVAEAGSNQERALEHYHPGLFHDNNGREAGAVPNNYNFETIKKGIPPSMGMNQSLRIWFLVHFLVDYIVAIPLFIFPLQTLSFLRWGAIDLLATRIVAAALLAIGGVSLVARNADQTVFRHLLTLKIIWSFAATAALIIAVIERDAPWGAWMALALFAFFGSVWVYYRSKL